MSFTEQIEKLAKNAILIIVEDYETRIALRNILEKFLGIKFEKINGKRACISENKGILIIEAGGKENIKRVSKLKKFLEEKKDVIIRLRNFSEKIILILVLDRNFEKDLERKLEESKQLLNFKIFDLSIVEVCYSIINAKIFNLSAELEAYFLKDEYVKEKTLLDKFYTELKPILEKYGRKAKIFFCLKQILLKKKNPRHLTKIYEEKLSNEKILEEINKDLKLVKVK